MSTELCLNNYKVHTETSVWIYRPQFQYVFNKNSRITNGIVKMPTPYAFEIKTTIWQKIRLLFKHKWIREH